MSEQITEKQAEALSRRRRDTDIELPDGSAYRNGVKIPAAARRRSPDVEPESVSGGQPADTPQASPASVFRPSSSSSSLDDYARERARDLKRQNDASGSADFWSPENEAKRSAAKADREAAKQRAEDRAGRYLEAMDAIRTGKPMPAGASFSMGGDPNHTIDRPEGTPPLSGAFKDGARYSLAGRTRAERIDDAKRQGIYERLIDENPGAYAESVERRAETGRAQARKDLSTQGSNGTYRTAGGGVIVVGQGRQLADYLPNGLPRRGYEGSALGAMTNQQVSDYFKANPTQANPNFIPGYGAAPAAPQAPAAAPAPTPDQVAARVDSNSQAAVATGAVVPPAALRADAAPDAVSQAWAAQNAGRGGGQPTTAPGYVFRAAPSAPQSPVAAPAPVATPGPGGHLVDAYGYGPRVMDALRQQATAPAPVAQPAPAAPAPATPAPLPQRVPINQQRPRPAAAFTTQAGVQQQMQETAAQAAAMLPGLTAPAPANPAGAFRVAAAARGTPISPSLPAVPGAQPTESLAARRRPPLITAFRSGTANA